MVYDSDRVAIVIKHALPAARRCVCRSVHRIMAVDAQELQIIPPVDCAIVRHVIRVEMSFVMDDEMRRLSCSSKGPVVTALANIVL